MRKARTDTLPDTEAAAAGDRGGCFFSDFSWILTVLRDFSQSVSPSGLVTTVVPKSLNTTHSCELEVRFAPGSTFVE